MITVAISAAAKAGSREVVVVDRDLEREGLAGWWNGLPQAQHNPMLRWEWLSTWAAAFVPPDGRLQIYEVIEAGEPVAALPLYRLGGWLFSLSNAHSDVFDAGWERGRLEAVEALVAAVGRQRLRLTRMDGESRLLAVEVAGGAPVVAEPVERAPYLQLPSSMDALLAACSRNFRSRARRAVRGLDALGEITYHDHAATAPGAGELLDEFIAMEGAGWKGVAGTAIRSRPSVLRFYRELTLASPASDWVRLSFLRADGRTIAAHYSLEYAGSRYLLKTTYDESIAAEKTYSPGLALMWFVLEDCIRRVMKTYEFTGNEERWKLDWTDTTRPRRTLLQWPRTPAGWLARHARAYGKPLLGPLVGRLRRLRTG